MKLLGKLIKDTKIIREAWMEKENTASFHDTLEECFVDLCRELEIPVPLWLRKNTAEFVRYRKTFFSSEHFIEKVFFDRFEIRIE